MDQQMYTSAQRAYQQGDYAVALTFLNSALMPGETNGAVMHLKGNALMKLSRFDEAAQAYGEALRDPAYGKIGALSANRGRAQAASGQIDAAILSLQDAVNDPMYPTPYKAYMALGKIYEQQNNMREAGVSYRCAAVDEHNPNPSAALMHLGKCFVNLNRPVDAVEAYRTALDFATPSENKAEIYAELGSAYVAANRMSEALDAFTHATEDPKYILSAEAQVAYHAAQRAVSAVAGTQPSDTDALLQAAGYADPLDPTGQTGQMMPSPDSTGFFNISEQDIVEQEKKDKKTTRAQQRNKNKKQKQNKSSHVLRNILIVLVLILVLLLGAGAFAYSKGYGYPTQQTVTSELFASKGQTQKIKELADSHISDADIARIDALLPEGAQIKVTDMNKSAKQSSVKLTATVSGGSELEYTVDLVRDGVAWKVSALHLNTNQVSNAATQQDNQTQTQQPADSLSAN